jgi:hypothetical protein
LFLFNQLLRPHFSFESVALRYQNLKLVVLSGQLFQNQGFAFGVSWLVFKKPLHAICELLPSSGGLRSELNNLLMDGTVVMPALQGRTPEGAAGPRGASSPAGTAACRARQAD